MLPLLAAGLIGAAGGLAGSAINAGASYAASQAQFENQIKFWNMQNEYDKPANQIARLQEAGLNPALAYGQGGNVANTSGSLPQVPRNEVMANGLINTGDLTSMIMRIASLEKLSAETDNVKAQTDYYKSMSGRTDAQTELTKRDISLKDFSIKMLPQIERGIINQRTLESLQIAIQQVNSDYATYSLPDRLAILSQEVENLKKKGVLTDAQVKAVDESIQEMRSKELLNYSMVNSNNELLPYRRDLYEAQTNESVARKDLIYELAPYQKNLLQTRSLTMADLTHAQIMEISSRIAKLEGETEAIDWNNRIKKVNLFLDTLNTAVKVGLLFVKP